MLYCLARIDLEVCRALAEFTDRIDGQRSIAIASLDISGLEQRRPFATMLETMLAESFLEGAP